MLPNIGPMELMLVLAIVLVIFGAGKIPEVGASLGKGIKNFKKSLSDVTEEPKTQNPEKSPEKSAEPVQKETGTK